MHGLKVKQISLAERSKRYGDKGVLPHEGGVIYVQDHTKNIPIFRAFFSPTLVCKSFLSS